MAIKGDDGRPHIWEFGSLGNSEDCWKRSWELAKEANQKEWRDQITKKYGRTPGAYLRTFPEFVSCIKLVNQFRSDLSSESLRKICKNLLKVKAGAEKYIGTHTIEKLVELGMTKQEATQTSSLLIGEFWQRDYESPERSLEKILSIPFHTNETWSLLRLHISALLVMRNARPNTSGKNFSGLEICAIHDACFHQDKILVSKLLEKGADSGKCLDTFTCLDIAYATNNKSIAKLLIKNGAKPKQAHIPEVNEWCKKIN